MGLLIAVATTPHPDTTFILADGVEVPMVFAEAGRFSREGSDGSPQTVVLTSGFWIGTYEVTWAQWRSIMGWDDGRGQPDHPARRVTWHQIQDFLGRASATLDGWELRLPTEAEWEYVARAGSDAPWPSGGDSIALGEYAWIRSNAGGVIQAVGTREPNSWGLHDMHGNVWEWVADWMAEYPVAGELTDPQGPPEGAERVRRGGSAVYGAQAATSSTRYQQPPDQGNGNLGFRVVAVRSAPSPG